MDQSIFSLNRTAASSCCVSRRDRCVIQAAIVAVTLAGATAAAAPTTKLFELSGSPAAYGQRPVVFERRSLGDRDEDGIGDTADNCLERFNPTQLDSDGDGFGNACDPDLNNDDTVNFLDLNAIKDAFFSTPASPNWNPDADLNGDSSVSFIDLAITKDFFFGQPGPTGLGLGTGFGDATALIIGEFNDFGMDDEMVRVGETSYYERTISLPAVQDQRYRILSADGATISCGGPSGSGPLPTPIDTLTTLQCGGGPEELAVNIFPRGRYRFSMDTSNPGDPTLIVRSQVGSGFLVPGVLCGVDDAGNNNAEFFGTDLFVRGSFNNWLDPGQGPATPAPPYQLINLGDREFQAAFEIVTGNYAFEIAAADWALEYGSTVPIILGNTQTIGRGGFGIVNPITVVESGCYTFRAVASEVLSMDDNAPESVDLTVKLGDPDEPTATPLVRGGFNGWGDTDPMGSVSATEFDTLVNVATVGTYDFKIESSDSTTINCGGPQDLGMTMDVSFNDATVISCGANAVALRAEFATTGGYLFSVDATNRDNPTLLVRPFSGAGFNSQGIGQPTVYLKGDFNLFGLDHPTTPAAGGRIYFTTISLVAGTYQFRFDSADATIISCGTSPGGDSTVTVGDTSIIACGEDLADLTVDIAADANYRFQLSTLAGTPRAPELTIIQL